MKKHILVLIPALTLALASCTGEGLSSSLSDSSSSSSSSSGSISSSLPDSRPSFSTVTDLMTYVAEEGAALEAQSATSYHRDSVNYALEMYGETTTTITQEGKAYANQSMESTGHQKEVYIDSEYEQFNKTEEVDFSFVATVLDEYLYQVIDYSDGQENDVARKDAVADILPGAIPTMTGTNTMTSLLSFYEVYLAPRTVSGFDDISPVRNDKNEDEYSHAVSWFTDGYTYSAELTLTLDSLGQVTSFDCVYLCTYLDSTQGKITVESINENFTLTYGEKVAAESLVLNPLDYFLTDYEIQLVWYDGVDATHHEVEANAFPYQRYVGVVVKNPVPEKALDTDLRITASSNQEVISIEDYGTSSVIQAVGEGDTTLTVISETGIQKTIDVHVTVPEVESVSIKIHSIHKYVGENASVYVDAEPDNAIFEYTLSSSSNVRLESSYNAEGELEYTAYFLEAGEAYIEAYLKGSDTPISRYEFTIENRLSREETIENIYGTWTGALPSENDNSVMVENAVTFNFLREAGSTENSFKGNFTINSEDTGFTFEVGKAYEFEWTIDPAVENYSTVSITLSTITFSTDVMEYVYDHNSVTFEPTGLTARADLQSSTSFLFWLQADLTKVS